MKIHNVRVPTCDILLEQILPCVRVDGNDWHVLHQNLLSVLKMGFSVRKIRGLGGPLDQRVVFQIGPAGFVVSPAGDEHIQESIGIVVITNPASTGDVVVHLALVGQVDFPLLYRAKLFRG